VNVTVDATVKRFQRVAVVGGRQNCGLSSTGQNLILGYLEHIPFLLTAIVDACNLAYIIIIASVVIFNPFHIKSLEIERTHFS
jgi:hypothetical protein